jgi:pimeloyl-ACP methyl ester carboxylesterase
VAVKGTTGAFVINERTIDTTCGQASWLEAGAGWPVILIHAFPLTATMWRPQLERVPGSWRFIAPHLRGASMRDYATAVLALMDALELETAVIGGLSMGGYVTFEMFRQASSRFAAMVLADTRAAADTPKGREGRIAMRALLAREGTAAVANEMLPKLFSSAASAEAVAFAREIIESNSPASVDEAIGALMDRPDSTPDLARISCASLVVVGERDAITPVEEADAMQRAMPRSRLCVIPGAGHLSSLEQPDAFSLALEDFLRSAL